MMRWEKLGLVFDTTQHKLPENCFAFAQSPQALVFDDYVRVYFATRSLEAATKKYLSHIAYVDMTKDFKQILRLSQKPVLPLGGLGTFDEHGIFPINVVRVGEAIYGYTCGWSRRVSVSVETGIGLAISHDGGSTFVRHGDGPVMSASLNEPCLVGDGFVRVVGDTFHMWYIYGLGWKHYAGQSSPDRIYKIAHATSEDGFTWRKDEGQPIIADRLGPDECQALPSVTEVNGTYHMVFCYRHASDFRSNAKRGYRLGYACSTDLINWRRDDAFVDLDVAPGGWDSDMQCYPHIFDCDGTTYLLYNGNEFGRKGFGVARLRR